MAFSLSSTAFDDGKAIPRKYTCEGDDLSPPLRWSDAPAGTQSFVLIVDDPDAPDPAAPRMTWVHWVVFNLPSDAAGLVEDIAELPAGAECGLNDWKHPGYGGPCPPIGRHRYVHKLYALDCKLTGLAKPTKAMVEAAMKGHVLAETKLVGTYEKSG